VSVSTDRLAARPRWRARLHEVIFEADTRAGRAFDVGLLVAILVSVGAVMLESVADVRREHGAVLRAVEWSLTAAFTLEYVLRLVLALQASRRKITVFLGGIVTIVMIVGTLMYVIEGEEHGFTSIPTSMYWAVVTMTTVGYGDIAPRTAVGQLLAALLMILGYGIIAVPTGIVSVELANAGRAVSRQACPSCGGEGHDIDARHCKYCGAGL